MLPKPKEQHKVIVSLSLTRECAEALRRVSQDKAGEYKNMSRLAEAAFREKLGMIPEGAE